MSPPEKNVRRCKKRESQCDDNELLTLFILPLRSLKESRRRVWSQNPFRTYDFEENKDGDGVLFNYKRT